jgi:hypothetical protein
MPNNQLPYDTSFAYEYQWSKPEADLEIALLILNSQVDELHDGQNCPAGKAEHQPIELRLASNPSTPTQVLDHISQCMQCPKVLERIAGHPNASADTLKRLAGHENQEVRSAVAENSSADIDILRDLMKDGNTDVRFCLAENPNVPAEILQELSSDENPYVAYRAQITLAKTGATPAAVKTITPQAQPKQARRAM